MGGLPAAHMWEKHLKEKRRCFCGAFLSNTLSTLLHLHVHIYDGQQPTQIGNCEGVFAHILEHALGAR